MSDNICIDQNCGECCKEIIVVYDYTQEDIGSKEALIEWAEARGLIFVKEQGTLMYLAIPTVCLHFLPRSNKCSIHDTKPDICKRFKCDKKTTDFAARGK